MAEETTERNTHVRASKVATYFGASGALSFGLTVLATVLHAPLSLAGLIFIGGGIALGCTEGGRNFLKKASDQLVDLGDDFMSHLGEDVGRLGKWWRRVTTPSPKAAAAPAAVPEAPPAFKAAANTQEFNHTAKPAEVKADIAADPTPKTGNGPKPIL